MRQMVEDMELRMRNLLRKSMVLANVSTLSNDVLQRKSTLVKVLKCILIGRDVRLLTVM